MMSTTPDFRSEKERAYEERLLLGGRWAPVTDYVLFVNATATVSAQVLIEGVYGTHVKSKWGFPLESREVEADGLEALLGNLEPFESGMPRRRLIIPTTNPTWSAVLTSLGSKMGSDMQSELTWFAVAGVEGVIIADSAQVRRNPSRIGSMGLRKIESYEIRPNGELVGHALGVLGDSPGRWFPIGGDASFPVGNAGAPEARRVGDRFTHEHLVEMAARYGLRPFDEDFYFPDGTATIVERTNPPDADMQTFTLAQLRGEAPS